MALHYAQHELLKLRESPMVRKPPGLPPVEEWMGPPVDPSSRDQNRAGRSVPRGKSEESFTNDGSSARRPPFDARGKSTTAPEDIVLGPPKTAFASAARRSTQRSSVVNHEDEHPKIEREDHRDRPPRDIHRHEKDGLKARDTRPGATYNRRSVKDDSDLWSGVRQQRNSNQDDHERVTKKLDDKELDQDRDGGREGILQRGFEAHRRNGNREINGDGSERRVAPSKNRIGPSWHDRKYSIGDDRTENTRPKERLDKDRRGARASDRDWTKNGRQELDPEWMDKPEPEEQNQMSEGGGKVPKTQDDFEQFMARMKAGNRPSQETSSAPIESKTTHDRDGSGAGTSTVKAKVDTPLVLDSGFDGFFGLLDRPKKDKDAAIKHTNGVQPDGASIAIKAPKSSKFSNLFKGDKAKDSETNPVEKALNLLPLEDSSNEDKAGFQRILKLLDQQQQQSSGQEAMATPAPPRQPTQASPPLRSPRREEQNDVFKLFGSRQANAMPPVGTSPPSNSEFFQNLMQKPPPNRQDLSSAPNRRANQESAPELLPFSNLTVSTYDAPQHTPTTGPPPGFFPDSSRDDLHRDKLNPNAGLDRRAAPPGFLDMPTTNTQRHSPAAFQQVGMPPGMQRPPGLESYHAGFAQPPQHTQQTRQNVGPPPGFHPQRGHNSYPPVLPPGLTSLPADRGMQYGMRTNGPGMPPPGFMGGPPSGYMQYGQEGLPYGGFDSGQFGQRFLPQQRRQ